MKRKTLTLLTAVVVSIALLMTGTYAWFYDTDEVPNEFRLANLGAKITEVFEPELVIPGISVRKDVAVSNTTSDIPILVRVKLNEVMRMLDPDTGTGAPFIVWNSVPDPQGPYQVVLKAATEFIVTLNNPVYGWEQIENEYLPAAAVANGVAVFRRVADHPSDKTQYTYFAYVASTGQLAQIGADIKHDKDGNPIPSTVAVTYACNRWETNTPASVDMLFDAAGNVTQGAYSASTPVLYAKDYVEIEFGVNVVFNPAAGVPEKNWFYYDGYFYYKGLLAPGEDTPWLVRKVDFLDTMDNYFQGAQYTLTPCLDALQPTMAALSSSAAGGWGLPTGSAAYQQLYTLCSDYEAP